MNEQRLLRQIAELQALRAELDSLGHAHLVAKADELIAAAHEDLAELLASRGPE